jgi:hypothetical protein
MCEKSDHLLPADRVTIGLQIQLDLAFPWAHAQCANQVQLLIVFKTRANGGSLPTRRPTPFEWRNQRKPAFIEENEGCAEFTPLFLPVARDSVSNGRSQHRLATDSAALWLLATPTESSQEIPNTARTIPYVKQVPDQMSHPIQRPVIFCIAVRISPPLQDGHYVL